jgi:pimeloyl-ACP methyl ester carboxylesterase
MADDVVAVMDQLGIEKASYCGLSMGGMVGMHLALKYPERINGLVLMSTSATEEPASNRTTYDMLNEQTRGTPPNPAVVQFLLGLMFSAEFRSRCPEVVKHFENKLQRVNDDPSYFSVRSVIHREGFEDAIAGIDLPTLVICAEADTSFPVSELELIHEKIPGSQLIRVPGAGHMSAVEHPDSVAEMIQGFLAPLWETSSKTMEVRPS